MNHFCFFKNILWRIHISCRLHLWYDFFKFVWYVYDVTFRTSLILKKKVKNIENSQKKHHKKSNKQHLPIFQNCKKRQSFKLGLAKLGGVLLIRHWMSLSTQWLWISCLVALKSENWTALKLGDLQMPMKMGSYIRKFVIQLRKACWAASRTNSTSSPPRPGDPKRDDIEKFSFSNGRVTKIQTKNQWQKSKTNPKIMLGFAMEDVVPRPFWGFQPSCSAACFFTKLALSKSPKIGPILNISLATGCYSSNWKWQSSVECSVRDLFGARVCLTSPLLFLIWGTLRWKQNVNFVANCKPRCYEQQLESRAGSMPVKAIYRHLLRSLAKETFFGGIC